MLSYVCKYSKCWIDVLVMCSDSCTPTILVCFAFSEIEDSNISVFSQISSVDTKPL